MELNQDEIIKLLKEVTTLVENGKVAPFLVKAASFFEYFGFQKDVSIPLGNQNLENSNWKMASKDIVELNLSTMSVADFLQAIGRFKIEQQHAGPGGEWMIDTLVLENPQGNRGHYPVGTAGNSAKVVQRQLNEAFSYYAGLPKGWQFHVLQTYRTSILQ